MHETAMDSEPSPRSPLASSAQILTLEPGTYTVTLDTPRPVASDVGFLFPRARLDAPPALPGAPVAVIGSQGENGWLSQPGDSAVVQVSGGRVSLLLTTQRIGGADAAPRLRIRQVAVPTGEPPGELPPALATPPVALRVHLGGQGDLGPDAEGWAGAAEAADLPDAIEGFSITPPPGLAMEDLEYQGILGEGWDTPWCKAGSFCGSRGLALPLLGLRIRLADAARDAWDCRYEARLTDGTRLGPVEAGAACGPVGDAALAALRLTLLPRAAALPEVPSGAR